MQYIGKIDIEIYSVITQDIETDEVIITEEQINHIKERHPDDYELFLKYISEMLENPDYIIESNKPKTALVLKEIIENHKTFKFILRLKTSSDPKNYKNSIITFMKINHKEYKRLIKNKKVLYKRE